MGTNAGHSTGGEHPAIVPLTGVCGFIDLEPTRAKISVGKRGRVHRNQAIFGPARSISCSIHCSTRWSIWRFAPRRLCRIY